MNSDSSPDPIMDRATRHRLEQQAVEEGGGGQSEGFELSERELIEHASHGDEHTPDRIGRDAGREEDQEPSDALYGEGDSEQQAD